MYLLKRIIIIYYINDHYHFFLFYKIILGYKIQLK